MNHRLLRPLIKAINRRIAYFCGVGTLDQGNDTCCNMKFEVNFKSHRWK